MRNRAIRIILPNLLSWALYAPCQTDEFAGVKKVNGTELTAG